MIAYLNDFKLMFVATLLVVPLVLLIRPARGVSERDRSRTRPRIERRST